MAGERLGAPAEDLHKEGRLRKIEQQLPVSSFTPSPDDVDLDDGLPQVAGLSVTAGVRNLTFKWEDADIPQVEFDYYEIQVSTSPSFPSLGLVIDRTQDLQYTFYEGDPNTVYYARVRAVLNDGRTGDFSVTVNLTTGLAVAGDFEPESIIVPSVAFTPSTIEVLNTDGFVTLQSLTVTLTGQPVLILVAFQHAINIAASSSARQDCTISRDGVSIHDFVVQLQNPGSIESYSVCVTFADEAPTAGSHTYTLTYDANNAGVGAGADVANRLLMTIELKR
jgi:hypothetical protein